MMWGGDPAAVGEGSFRNGAEGETRLDMDVPEDSDVLLGAQAPVEGGVCVSGPCSCAQHGSRDTEHSKSPRYE